METLNASYISGIGTFHSKFEKKRLPRNKIPYILENGTF